MALDSQGDGVKCRLYISPATVQDLYMGTFSASHCGGKWHAPQILFGKQNTLPERATNQPPIASAVLPRNLISGRDDPVDYSMTPNG